MLEQQAAPVGNALMGSDHTYVIPGAGGAPATAGGAPAKGAAATAAKRCAGARLSNLSYCRPITLPGGRELEHACLQYCW